ncbi:MAG: hypothetical protein HON57_06310 [Flavobacteriaceae bacterium]|jgi:hypothetical protein|nr:hypothetical protein [Candidatus Arcticimaribacter sp.]
MARQRKHDLDKQTHFAKTHSRVLKGVYMTDVDSLQIVNTENKVYEQYKYIKINGKSIPDVQRYIEIKSRMSKYLAKMFAKEIEPTQQVVAQAYFIAQANAFKRANKLREVDYWFVVEDEGEYPYEIWSVTTTFGTGEIHFKQIGEVMNDEQYNAFFDIT